MKTTLLILTFGFALIGTAQLQPGYRFDESMELIKVNFRFVDSVHYADFPAPQRFEHRYRSPVVGLDNCWDWWEDQSGAGVISIRGTTGSGQSWASNFYSAMVPAKGWMKISEKDTFRYELATHPKAAVHVGWLLSAGCLLRDIMPHLEAFIAAGKRDLFITGHSQGGAIAYLINAQLMHLRKTGKLPADLRIKTYCSAAPKPGNLWFAYSYESLTYPGWAFNTVNAADWVPETPFSIQTVQNFNATNPFSEVTHTLKGVRIPVRWFLKSAYRKMDKPTRKSRRRFEKYLGRKLGKQIEKFVPGFEPPPYVEDNAYVRCGTFVSMVPEADYFSRYPENGGNNTFLHHSILPYLYLMEQMASSE